MRAFWDLRRRLCIERQQNTNVKSNYQSLFFLLSNSAEWIGSGSPKSYKYESGRKSLFIPLRFWIIICGFTVYPSNFPCWSKSAILSSICRNAFLKSEILHYFIFDENFSKIFRLFSINFYKKNEIVINQKHHINSKIIILIEGNLINVCFIFNFLV